jgi:hypothetical protein
MRIRRRKRIKRKSNSNRAILSVFQKEEKMREAPPGSAPVGG